MEARQACVWDMSDSREATDNCPGSLDNIRASRDAARGVLETTVTETVVHEPWRVVGTIPDIGRGQFADMREGVAARTGPYMRHWVAEETQKMYGGGA